MPTRKPTLQYAAHLPAAGPSGAAILRITLAVTCWAVVALVGIVCVSAGTIAFLAWSTTPPRGVASRELPPLLAIGCLTLGGGTLVRFAFLTIQEMLRGLRRGPADSPAADELRPPSATTD